MVTASLSCEESELIGMNLESLTILQQATTNLGLKHYLAAIEPRNRLTLDRWKITDVGLVHLQGLTSLERLSLKDSQVTDAGVAELQQALPKCLIRKQPP